MLFIKLPCVQCGKMTIDSSGRCSTTYLRPARFVYCSYFLMLSFLFPFYSHAFQSTQKLVATQGVIDLRQVDLSKNTVALTGEWGIYWKQLLTTDKQAGPPVYVDFPQLWRDTKINGQVLPSVGYASYTLTVLLPHERGKLALEVPDTYSSYRLFVNGEEFSSAGKPGTTKETSEPKWLLKTLELTTHSDTLHLVLQVANFWHIKGGPYKKILIGDRDTLFKNRDNAVAFDLLLTGCLLMAGFFFLGLFLFARYDKVLLFFSLFCLTYSYRIIGAGFYVLHSLFPDIPWIITIHFEYLSLFISVIFFSIYTRKLYPDDTNKTFVLFGVWTCVALSLIVIIFPPAIFTQLITPFLIYMFGFITYAFYVYVRAVRNKRVGAIYALMSTGVIFVIFFVINLQYFRLVAPQKVILFTGYFSFFFLQSLVLSFRFSYTLNRARKQAEEGLQAKNEFLSTMSHEIRTPLNSVLGLTHLILRNNPRPEQKEQLDVLLFSANNLLAIVNDILDYNKIEAGKVHFELIEMDLAGLVKNITSGLRSMAEDKGIRLDLYIDPALRSKILGDPTRIGQVITNLVNNAIKFTLKGSVLLEILVVTQTDTNITLTVRVEDTGIGIAPENQRRIFEEFTQADASTSRNFGGTGLGLAICKKILALQGSVLQVSSEPGKGSVFYFTQTFTRIGRSTEVITSALEKLPSEDSKPLSGITILLVEDNEINILVAKTFLERWGADIDVAMNGQEAIDMVDVKKHRLILMDLHMPVLDGYEATKRLREKNIRLPIVALTASLPKEVEKKVKGIGFDDIVVKPFVPDDLYRIVLHYTDVQRSESLE